MQRKARFPTVPLVSWIVSSQLRDIRHSTVELHSHFSTVTADDIWCENVVSFSCSDLNNYVNLSHFGVSAWLQRSLFPPIAHIIKLKLHHIWEGEWSVLFISLSMDTSVFLPLSLWQLVAFDTLYCVKRFIFQTKVTETTVILKVGMLKAFTEISFGSKVEDHWIFSVVLCCVQFKIHLDSKQKVYKTNRDSILACLYIFCLYI